jgi:hypothetical protein
MSPQFNVNITQDQILRDSLDSKGKLKNQDLMIIKGSDLSVKLNDVTLTDREKNQVLHKYVETLDIKNISKQSPQIQQTSL